MEGYVHGLAILVWLQVIMGVGSWEEKSLKYLKLK